MSTVMTVPRALKSDGVAVTLKGLSLSLSGYFHDVDSCLWLVNVAHAHLMRWSHWTCAAFLKMMNCPNCWMFPAGGKGLDVHPVNCYRVVLSVV